MSMSTGPGDPGQTQPVPQDAPPPAPAAPPTSALPTSPPPTTTPSTTQPATTHPATNKPPKREIVRIPAPGGPNWGLILYGLFCAAVAVGVVANQTSGFVVHDLFKFGPSALVAVGLLCAAVGIVGIASRGRRR